MKIETIYSIIDRGSFLYFFGIEITNLVIGFNKLKLYYYY